MTACTELRILFRAPAGPGRGYHHVLRCRALARALGVRPLLCVRGPEQSIDVALRFGCDVVSGSPRRLLRALQLDVLIVDDPEPHAAACWIEAAREFGAAVATIHDVGIGCHDADLLIDGSVITTLTQAARRSGTGPAFDITEPEPKTSVASLASRQRVVVSLGGGVRSELACAIAGEIARRAPDVDVRVHGGFVSGGRRKSRPRQSLRKLVSGAPPANRRHEPRATARDLEGN